MKPAKLVLIFVAMFLMMMACKPEEVIIDVTGIELEQTELNLEIGETATLRATITPDEASNKALNWRSSAGGVVSVTQDGVATALSEGTALIEVTTMDGDFKAYCTIIVVSEAIHASEISVDVTSDTLDITCTLQLIATVLPENTTNKNINWSSSDPSVATIDNSGLITAIKGGTTIISAATTDGKLSANCTLFVKSKGSIITIMEKGFLKTTGNNVGVDLATNKEGIPFLALNAYNSALATESKAQTEVWKNTQNNTWNRFGDRVDITDDEALAPGIIIDDQNKVYVSHLYFDDDKDIKYTANVVSYSTGNSWEYLGEGSKSLIKNGSTKLYKGSELAIKPDGTLLVANVQSGDGFVHYWDNEWKSYNGYKTDSPNFWAGGIDIECFGNTPYISIRTSSGDGTTGILVGNEENGINGAWEWLGKTYSNSASENCHFQDEKVSESSIAINTAGDVFSAYYASGKGIILKKFSKSGSKWSTIYSKDASDIQQVEVVVANDEIYLLVADYNRGISINRLTACGSWLNIGTTPKPDSYYNFDAIAGVNGEIIIAYECNNSNKGQVGVFKYTPSIQE